MKEFFTAIYGRYDAGGDLKTNLSGGLHLFEAPQSTAKPYGTYFLVSNVPDWEFAEHFEESLIQFDLFDENTSAGRVCDLYNYLKALYDDCSLNISDAISLFMWREFSRLSRMPEDNVWQYTVQYRVRQQQ